MNGNFLLNNSKNNAVIPVGFCLRAILISSYLRCLSSDKKKKLIKRFEVKPQSILQLLSAHLIISLSLFYATAVVLQIIITNQK